MFMRMCRNCIAGRSEFHMICPFDHNFITGMYTGKDLNLPTIVSAELHFLLLVSFGIHLQIHKIHSLLFRDGCLRQYHDIFHLSGKQINLHIRTGDNIDTIVKFKSDGQIEQRIIRRLPIGKHTSVKFVQSVHTVIIRSLKIGRHHTGQIFIVTLRHFGTEEKTTILSKRHEWLAYSDIITFFHQAGLHITANGRQNALSRLSSLRNQCLIAQTSILVCFLNGGKFLL